ncbi:MAG TPA: cytochrome c peroxidase [Gemmatimonadaceae bacterium]|jgi:cytochrome c peroxidase|nr:cytochrome c peroxidase [Gemmatimonadaceae bacterium]
MTSILALLRSAAAGACLIASTADTTSSPATRVFEAQLDSLLVGLDTLASEITAGRTVLAQRAFRRTRTAYKRAEGLLAYYAPTAVTMLQGPLEGDADEIYPRPYNTPGAFPAVESAIFPRLADSARTATLARIHAMREQVSVLRSMTESLDVDEPAVYDAARAEIARVSTLDISGFDSDRQDDALLDAAAALDGVRATLVAPVDTESAHVGERRQRADRALRDAAGYLRHHATFERMDRLTFVARYSLPASHALADLRVARAIPHTPAGHLWRDDAASVYDSGAFDAIAYTPRHANIPIGGAALVALGARLFADARLSGPGTRSCAGCHLPTRAFTDGLSKRTSLTPELARPVDAPPPRRTPTLINAALQPTLFADERARGLEQQIDAVLSDPNEMRSSSDTAVSRVAADSTYREAFARAFGTSPDRAVTGLSLRVALASYIRSLTALNAPFDRAVRGDSAALSAAARRGFTVFMGKGRCGTCHFAPLFNGTQPPLYRTTDPEIIGVPEQPVLRHARLDPDRGRGLIDRVDTHRFAFKVPTVRNAALTAPYMHNGAYRSLDDVVAFYNAGGGAGIGIDLPYQTLFDQPLHLTRRERTDLIAFMRALTDTSGTTRPAASVALH